MLGTISWVLLGASVCSFWAKRLSWLWSVFLCISLVVSLLTQVMHPKGLIPIIILASSHLSLKQHPQGVLRLFFLTLTSIISLSMYLNLLSGYGSVSISSTDTFQLSFSYDTAFMGLFVLGFRSELLTHDDQKETNTPLNAVLALICIVLILTLSSFMKLWTISFSISLWKVIGFIALAVLSVIPQEAFFRGFLQKEISHSFGKWGALPSILSVSLLVGLCMGIFFMSIKLGIFMLIVNLGLGSLFNITKKIEYPIAVHAIILFFLVFFASF